MEAERVAEGAGVIFVGMSTKPDPLTTPADLPPDLPDLTPEERAKRRRFYEKFLELRGKIHLKIDLDELRGRNRR